MGIVTDKVIALVKAQIQAHGTVVWYDPDGTFAGPATALTADQVGAQTLYRYSADEGFFALRHNLEAIWKSEDLTSAPKLLIYAPIAQARAEHALIEYEVGGTVMQPGQQPPERNTELSAVARLALEGLIPGARLAQIVDQAAAGQLSLAELDQLAEQGTDVQTGTLGVVFGTGTAAETMLRFLGDPGFDARLSHRKSALADVAKLFSDALGVELKAEDPIQLRSRVARQIMMTEFFETLGSEANPSPIPLAKQPAALAAAIDLATQWRNRRDFAPTYVEWAGKIEPEIGLGSRKLGLDDLAKLETFAAAEIRLQSEVEEALSLIHI